MDARLDVVVVCDFHGGSSAGEALGTATRLTASGGLARLGSLSARRGAPPAPARARAATHGRLDGGLARGQLAPSSFWLHGEKNLRLLERLVQRLVEHLQ